MFVREVKVLLAVVALGAAVGMSATVDGQTGAGSAPSETEWRFFGGDAGATRYSPASASADAMIDVDSASSGVARGPSSLG